MFFLAIETSCDETSLCLACFKEDLFKIKSGQKNLTFNKNFNEKNLDDLFTKIEILASLVSSQIKIHQEFGGVIPELGARKHAEQIHFLFNQLIRESQKNTQISQKETLKFIKHIFVTTEPGLNSALLVGLEFARSLSFFLEQEFKEKVQINKINHLHGHVASCFWQKTDFPILYQLS